MRVEEFSMLVHEHAKRWAKAGEAHGATYDPFSEVYIEEAREISRQLVAAFKREKTSL